ncbi:MAG: diguanylate cyclase [Helicobacteraceae bacterium]|nr:diguanylate cyclase [Helicobacteraceae bacterium]
MSEQKTILIVDDTETNIDILVDLLDDYDIRVALDGMSAIEIVNDENIDLILLDIMMPEIDGFEVCRRLKQNPANSNIPIIFLTAKTDEDSIEKAYETGGSDFVTKPFRPRELLARVNKELKLQSMIKHLEYISSRDVMTGIYNRRKFFELSTYIFETQKNNLYTVMIDIDKFKSINDQYGHPTGDKVIKMVAKTISEYITTGTVFGRLGGEEFAIVCTNKTDDEVMQDIESIRVLIQDLEVLSDDGEVIKFTISNGISKINENTESLDELLKHADDALYEAKGTGRNKVIFGS